MDKLLPIYTEKTECHDCYKCLRHCPVKAIGFENGHARIDPALCILCGQCVSVCPAGAKKGREETGRVKALLQGDYPVILSLAPSWTGEFPGLTEGGMIRLVRALGFAGVSETALGAEAVSAAAAAALSGKKRGLCISTACPSVVEFIRKYRPELVPFLLESASPLLTHCGMLKESLGGQVQVVFAGPCLAKKREADQRPDLLAAALSWEELRRLFREADLNPAAELQEPFTESGDPAGETFLLGRAGRGALYPYDGGMCESLRECTGGSLYHALSFSGMQNILLALEDWEQAALEDRPVFLELLACPGGCINGPKSRSAGGTMGKRIRVLRRWEASGGDLRGEGRADISLRLGEIAPGGAAPSGEPGPEEMARALARVGKTGPADELNCAGCGYNTCREFAAACLAGRAEPVMCVSYMRTLAQKKANAIIGKMPSGVVIVDADLVIIESNRKFAELLGEEALLLWEARPCLEGALLSRLAGFSSLVRDVLEQGGEILDRRISHNGKVLNITVFPIQDGQVAGAILQDITIPWVNRDNIVKKAQEVISRNLETVQQIAYLLGENAAENEVILNSLVESFSGKDMPFSAGGEDGNG